MKISKEQASEHRARLLAAAERLFRERGYEGVSLSEIAKAAGLTHGAFYTYFASKEALFAEACETALTRSAMAEREARDPDPLLGLVLRYLLPEHVHMRGDACPMAALSGDASRAPLAARQGFARGLDQMIRAIDGLDPDPAQEVGRRRALTRAAQLVGTLVLARAAAGSPLESELLDATRASFVEAAAGRGPKAT